jgi:hypothetical protein
MEAKAVVDAASAIVGLCRTGAWAAMTDTLRGTEGVLGMARGFLAGAIGLQCHPASACPRFPY